MCQGRKLAEPDKKAKEVVENRWRLYFNQLCSIGTEVLKAECWHAVATHNRQPQSGDCRYIACI